MSTLIVLIAHAPLAGALRECALHVFPDCGDALCAIDVPPDAPPEQSLLNAQGVLSAVGLGRSVLVLTDVFGATPCNVAQKLMEKRVDTKLVSGVNLPMLLRAVSYREEALDRLVQRAVVGGTQGVMQVTAHAPQNQTRHSHDQSSQSYQQ